MIVTPRTKGVFLMERFLYFCQLVNTMELESKEDRGRKLYLDFIILFVFTLRSFFFFYLFICDSCCVKKNDDQKPFGDFVKQLELECVPF
jgi:hypothetical protein